MLNDPTRTDQLASLPYFHNHPVQKCVIDYFNIHYLR